MHSIDIKYRKYLIDMTFDLVMLVVVLNVFCFSFLCFISSQNQFLISISSETFKTIYFCIPLIACCVSSICFVYSVYYFSIIQLRFLFVVMISLLSIMIYLFCRNFDLLPNLSRNTFI